MDSVRGGSSSYALGAPPRPCEAVAAPAECRLRLLAERAGDRSLGPCQGARCGSDRAAHPQPRTCGRLRGLGSRREGRKACAADSCACDASYGQRQAVGCLHSLADTNARRDCAAWALDSHGRSTHAWACCCGIRSLGRLCDRAARTRGTFTPLLAPHRQRSSRRRNGSLARDIDRAPFYALKVCPRCCTPHAALLGASVACVGRMGASRKGQPQAVGKGCAGARDAHPVQSVSSMARSHSAGSWNAAPYGARGQIFDGSRLGALEGLCLGADTPAPDSPPCHQQNGEAPIVSCAWYLV